MAGAGKVAAVVGASHGVGYTIVKEMALRIPNAKLKLYAEEGQEILDGLQRLLKHEIGVTCNYRTLELKDSRSISKKVGSIKQKYGTVDILVNNASIYYKPPASHHSYGVPEVNAPFVKEAKQCIRTNYTAFKEVTNKFLPIMGQNSRIVNVGSHLGLLRNIPSLQLREAFAQPDITEKHLDELIASFLLEIERGTHEEEGWPSCAYTVSKVAVNSYTGILQRRLDNEMPDRGIAVNCVKTGNTSSKMKVKQLGLNNVECHPNAAQAVAYIATHGLPEVDSIPPKVAEVTIEEMPRGKLLWANLKEVDWCAEKTNLDTKSTVHQKAAEEAAATAKAAEEVAAKAAADKATTAKAAEEAAAEKVATAKAAEEAAAKSAAEKAATAKTAEEAAAKAEADKAATAKAAEEAAAKAEADKAATAKAAEEAAAKAAADKAAAAEEAAAKAAADKAATAKAAEDVAAKAAADIAATAKAAEEAATKAAADIAATAKAAEEAAAKAAADKAAAEVAAAAAKIAEEAQIANSVDPMQQLFVDSIRGYSGLSESSPEAQGELENELDRVAKQFGVAGGHATVFPEFSFEEPVLDPINIMQ